MDAFAESAATGRWLLNEIALLNRVDLCVLWYNVGVPCLDQRRVVGQWFYHLIGTAGSRSNNCRYCTVYAAILACCVLFARVLLSVFQAPIVPLSANITFLATALHHSISLQRGLENPLRQTCIRADALNTPRIT